MVTVVLEIVSFLGILIFSGIFVTEQNITVMRKPKGYWNVYENCRKEAEKYKTRSEFSEKSQVAYYYARKNGWMDTFDFFLPENEARRNAKLGQRKWTKEECLELARECTSREDFRKKHGGAYKFLKRYYTLDECNWFKTPERVKHTENDYVVYVYEDTDNRCAYIGLTDNLRKRHNAHRAGKKYNGVRKFDTVASHFIGIGIELPYPIVKEENLSSEDAQYYEGFYVDLYRDNGWTILNKGKTGKGTSSLGGTYRKWTHEALVEASKEYSNRSDFGKGNPKAYKKAYQYGLMDELYPNDKKQNPKNYWDYSTCLLEAIGCKTKGEFKQKNATAYSVARKNGWLKFYIFFKPTGEVRSEENHRRFLERMKKPEYGILNVAI